MSNDLPKAITEMNALPDISANDSARLQGFVRMTTTEIKAVGGVGVATTLEMIGYIRELEHKLARTPITTERLIDPWHATEDDYRISPASAAPVVDEPDEDVLQERQSTVNAIAYEFMKLFGATAKDGWTHDEMQPVFDATREIITRTFPVLAELAAAAATAAPQVSNDLLRDAGAIIIVNEGGAGARVEIRFAELQDAQRLHQALAQMRVAAPVDHNSIPLNSYERILTIEWDKYNARRHELIKAERSRVLSESEVLELFELQWLARIKRGLSSGPRIAQKQPLPDHFPCINPEEQPTVINFLRGYGTDADRELARLHLNLCLRCQELANAAPVEQSDAGEPYYHMGQRETQLVDKIVAAVKAEQLHEDLDNPEDAGYRNAINDALKAIRSVCAEEGIEVVEERAR